MLVRPGAQYPDHLSVHRPWPIPSAPWVMRQTWSELLFAHWPVPADMLRPHIPAGLTLDTYDGQAWVGVVPFRMSDVAPRFVPAVPWLSHFPEVNVRTYVTRDGKPGVWFYSLDADQLLAVQLARTWFHLPYKKATMRCRAVGEIIHYESVRTDQDASPARFVAEYRPVSPVYRAEPGSQEQWLTERYCLYARDRRGAIYRGEIDHVPWPLQRAEAAIRENSMAAAAGITLPDVAPLLHYASEIRVRVWPLRRC